MRSLMAAVARILAAIMITVVVWCEALARFVQRTLPGHVEPAPAAVVDKYDAAAEAVKVAPEPDQRMFNIQLAAEALFRGQDVTADMLKGFSPKTLGWLEVLDADMLIAVARAKPSALEEHLALRQQIRGVLRFEDDAIEAYRQAVEADAKVPKRPDSAPSRIYPTASHLPAFGPIC